MLDLIDKIIYLTLTYFSLKFFLSTIAKLKNANFQIVCISEKCNFTLSGLQVNVNFKLAIFMLSI